MSKRRTYNWPQIFADFEQSNLTQAEFCKQRNINPNYFSLKLSRHKTKASPESAFSKVIVQPQKAFPQRLILEVGHCRIHCPDSMSIPSLASLVKSLA